MGVNPSHRWNSDHLDRGALGLPGGLPSHTHEQVDADVHRHHVRDRLPSDHHGDQDDQNDRNDQEDYDDHGDRDDQDRGYY